MHALRLNASTPPIKEQCRPGGFSYATFYKWQAKYGGIQATDAKRLRELEGENDKHKQLLPEPHLDIHSLRDLFGVKPQPRCARYTGDR